MGASEESAGISALNRVGIRGRWGGCDERSEERSDEQKIVSDRAMQITVVATLLVQSHLSRICRKVEKVG